MRKTITTILTLTCALNINAQNWLKISGIMDSSDVKGIGVINNQILVAGQNLISNTITDYAVSNDGGNTWSNLPTYNFAGYLPNVLPQNNLQICSNGFTSSSKLVGNAWQVFSGANNFAEFSNGSIIGSKGSFPDTLYNFSSTGIKGSKLGNYTFKLGAKYCAASNNRLFLFAYGVGIGYIDYSNLGIVNIPATLNAIAMTQNDWDNKLITNIIKTSNGDLFAIGDGLFKSTDNGVNWTTIQYYSGDLIVSIAKSATDELYMIVQNNVLKSIDLGVSFTDISGNLTNVLGLKKDVFVNSSNEVFVISNKNGADIGGIFKLSNPTGLNSYYNNLQVSIHPNPSNNIFNITNTAIIDKITITNIQGAIVLSKNCNETSTNIDLNDFGNGIYFLQITSGNSTTLKKIIKN